MTLNWKNKPTIGWFTAVGAVLAGFVIISVFKGLGSLLPPPETVIPKTAVVLRGDGEDAWSLALVKDGSTSPLECQPASSGFLNGWDCGGSHIYTHSITNFDDPILAVRRAIRAAYLSDLPEGKVTDDGGVVSVQLSAEETKSLDEKLADGDVAAGILIQAPTGTEESSLVVVVQGPMAFVDDISNQVLQSVKS